MSYVITQPQMLATAAADVAGVGSTISEADAAAPSRTTGVVTAAADEVSGGIATAFDEFAQEYQAVITNAAAVINGEFAPALAAASSATDAVSVLLPTADIGLVLGVTLPTYDLNLFLGGIQTAVNGNPVGLIDAIGYPIAAGTGLIPAALFIEGESVLETAGVSFGDI
jgi:hypothetical protein